MLRRPPRSTRTDTLFPYTTLFRSLAQDFMAQLAALHRIDVAASPVEGMGPVEPAEAYIRRRVASLRAANGGQAWAPLIHLSLDWLGANVPAAMPAPVIS